MTAEKNRNKIIQEIAWEQRERCRDWLLPFMKDGHSRLATKAELRDQAIQELQISRMSFDFAWIDAIETAGRQDWYEPLPRRRVTKN